MQLQVVNAPIPADEVGRKVFFEPGRRATAGLAAEYNRILNDKMREGVSNLVRHRYLTYAVGADDVDAAVPKLARIRGDVEQTLARIRCLSHALDGAERLELLQGQLRSGSRFELSWDKLSPTSGARTKDFVMPSTLDFKPESRSDCFCSDGRYGAVLVVRSFGSVIEETYLASIIDLPRNVTLHVQPIAQSEALALVKRQIDWMDKEIIDEQMSAVKKGYDYQILPPELRFSKEEAEELLDFLRNKSERLFVYTGLVYTWADSLDEAGGGYYGQSKESGNLVLCDRQRLASPMGFVCGKPGSGKSFSVKREITNTVLAHPEDEVVIFDPAGEYGNLVGALGGANVELAPGCSAVLNPPPRRRQARVQDRRGARALERAHGRGPRGPAGARPLDHRALRRRGVPGVREDRPPAHARRLPRGAARAARARGLRHRAALRALREGRVLLLQRPGQRGARQSHHQHRHARPRPEHARVRHDHGARDGAQPRDGHAAAPNYTWLYIDEVQSLFAHPTVVEYFARLWREGRKFGLICTGISQNTSHMLANAEARDMVLNSEFFLLHKQSTADLDAWAEMLQLSATERGYIGDASTAISWNRHSRDTNANDALLGNEGAIVASDMDPKAGIWFSLGENGSSAPVDDSLAALPYGAYTI